MAEMNILILKENVRKLLKNRSITQQELAETIGMSQANVSKALNPDEKKCFTVEQLFKISQNYHVSIDALTGNICTPQAAMSPKAVMSYLAMLLRSARMKATTVEIDEEIYEMCYDRKGYPDCNRYTETVTYPAFYFPSYLNVLDLGTCDEEYQDIDMEFCMTGNESKFKVMNEVMNKFIAVIKLYWKHEIPEEALQMILDGYLEQLQDK